MRKCARMKKTQTGTQAQREGSKQRFHVLPRRRRFPKSCKTKAAGLQLFMHACDFSFFLFSFFPRPVSRAHKEQLGSTREQPTQWFLFKGHFPSKKKKETAPPVALEAVMNLRRGHKTCSTPASERLLRKAFPASQRLTFKKSANHSFQAPSVTPLMCGGTFFHICCCLFLFYYKVQAIFYII